MVVATVSRCGTDALNWSRALAAASCARPTPFKSDVLRASSSVLRGPASSVSARPDRAPAFRCSRTVGERRFLLRSATLRWGSTASAIALPPAESGLERSTLWHRGVHAFMAFRAHPPDSSAAPPVRSGCENLPLRQCLLTPPGGLVKADRAAREVDTVPHLRAADVQQLSRIPGLVSDRPAEPSYGGGEVPLVHRANAVSEVALLVCENPDPRARANQHRRAGEERASS